MKRFGLFALLWLLLATLVPAVAQVGLPWPGPGTPASSGGGGSCCTLVTHQISNAPVNTVPTSSAFALSSGNLLFIVCDGVVSPSPSDTAGNTFTPITGVFTAYYAKNTTANASNVISCNGTVPGGGFAQIYVMQYSGASATAPLDKECDNNNSGSGGGVVSISCSASITTTAANEVVASAAVLVSTAVTFTAGGSASMVDQTTDGGGSYGSQQQFLTSTSTLTPSITWSPGTGQFQYFEAVSFK